MINVFAYVLMDTFQNNIITKVQNVIDHVLRAFNRRHIVKLALKKHIPQVNIGQINVGTYPFEANRKCMPCLDYCIICTPQI